MLTELGASRSLFSTTYSLGTLVSALTLLNVGRQSDCHGSRLVMTLVAIVIAGAIFFMSGVGGVLTLAIGFSLLRASSQGVLKLAARTLVPHWFLRRRGRAFNLIGLAAAASLAVVPVANEVMIRHRGWRDAWRAYSVIVLLVLAPLLWFCVRDRPEQAGPHPGGIPADPVLPHLARDEYGYTLKQALRTPAFWELIRAGLALVNATPRGVPGSLWSAGADVAWPSSFGKRHLGSIRGFGCSMGPVPFGLAYDLPGLYDPAMLGLLILPVVAGLAVMLAQAPSPVLAVDAVLQRSPVDFP
jgi:MFS family permease